MKIIYKTFTYTFCLFNIATTVVATNNDDPHLAGLEILDWIAEVEDEEGHNNINYHRISTSTKTQDNDSSQKIIKQQANWEVLHPKNLYNRNTDNIIFEQVEKAEKKLKNDMEIGERLMSEYLAKQIEMAKVADYYDNNMLGSQGGLRYRGW